MYISKVRLRRYKSFRDSGQINFKPGINIIVGQNNAGKTALLEGISLKFKNTPHKSLRQNVETSSRVDFEVFLSSSELQNVLKNPIQLRFPRDGRVHKAALIVSDQVKIGVNFKANSNGENWSLSETFYQENPQRNDVLSLGRWNGDYFESQDTGDLRNSNHIFGYEFIESVVNGVYRFNAERPNLGNCLVGLNRQLNADASNLAEVLVNTQTNNPHIYEDYNNFVSEILPSVKWVSSVRTELPNAPGKLPGAWNEVKIWTADKQSRREDLAFPLSTCGTGVGQVLAILYVVVTTIEPRVIIIDEPNSFLHPGAAKKLIQILNKFPQHQYFISTHSPEIISAARPSTITRLKYEDGETTVESFDFNQKEGLRETFSELGIKLSDFFFADNVLWAEGETEEKAFPLILEKMGLSDVTVLHLVPSEIRSKRFARKNAKLVSKIYNQLSGADAISPPQINMILDKEDVSEQEISDLKKEIGDHLVFIPRKMLENYLLVPEAIASVYNAEPQLAEDKKVTVETVERWISEKREKKEYLPERFQRKATIKDKEWLENVDGAKLLEDLFKHLKGNIEYRKTTHSVKLTKWLLENKPDYLAELKDFLMKILKNE